MSQNSEYFNNIFNKFKTNPDDPDLSAEERVLLGQVAQKERAVSDLTKKIQETSKSLQSLEQQILFEEGQLTGLVNAFMALKSVKNGDTDV